MLKKLLIAASLVLSASAPAWSQAGQFPSGFVQGNAGASAGQGKPNSVTSLLDRALGSTRGSILERSATGWAAVGPGATAGLPYVSAGAGADPAYQLLGAVGGGTNNAFFQVSGPASSIKTYTFPNANSTMAALATVQTWTGAQSFTDSDLILLGSSSGSVTLHAPATGGASATFFSGTDTVAGLAATQTFTNKTFAASTDVIGGVTMTLGSDATGDIYYRNAGGVLTRLAVGSGTQVLGVSGGLPAWTAAGAGNVSNSGTPTANQIAQWTSSTQIQGITTVPAANGGAGTITGALKGNGAGVVSQAATSDLSDVTVPTAWTPSDASGASLTFTSVTALYTKIGKHVVAQFRLTYPSTASSAQAAIGGLPVASSSSGATFASGVCTSTLASPNSILGMTMAANGTNALLIAPSSAGAVSQNAAFSLLTVTCDLSYISN